MRRGWLLFWCYVFPPVAVLSCGEILGTIANVILLLWPWSSARQHALMTCEAHWMDERFGLEKNKPRLSLMSQDHGHELDSPTIDDPTVGTHGTKFRPRT